MKRYLLSADDIFQLCINAMRYQCDLIHDDEYKAEKERLLKKEVPYWATHFARVTEGAEGVTLDACQEIGR